VTSVVYDAGALIAAERNDRRMWAEHRVRLESDIVPVAPTVVVAQVSRSPRQVQLRRMLRGCDVSDLTEATAHDAGALLAASATSDVVDAVVVTEADRHSTDIVTSDRADVTHLLNSLGRRLVIIDV
jgi:hypothetical protein